MLNQPSLADLDYQHKRHKTRWEQFPERLDALAPRSRLEAGSSPLSQRWEGTQPLSPVSVTFSLLSASLSTRTICSSVNLLPFLFQSSVLFILPENNHSYWYSFRGKCQNAEPNHRTWVLILHSMVGPAGFALFNKWPTLPPIV